MKSHNVKYVSHTFHYVYCTIQCTSLTIKWQEMIFVVVFLLQTLVFVNFADYFLFTVLFFAAMSENYIVFIEQPIKLELLKFMLYRIAGKSFHKVMSWNPELETIFHVANRHTGQARDQCYNCEHVN